MRDISKIINEIGTEKDVRIHEIISLDQPSGRFSFHSKLANFCYTQSRYLRRRNTEKADELDQLILTYFGFVTQSFGAYSDFTKQLSISDLSPILLGNFAFKVIIKIKSTYDVVAVIHQVLKSNDLIPEDKWTDIAKLYNSWNQLKEYWNYSSIEDLSSIRNKIVHRGYDIQFNGIKNELALLRSNTNDAKRGFNIEIIDLDSIIKNFIVNLFNLEIMILNDLGESNVDYRYNSLTTLGYDSFGISDINYILSDAYGNGAIYKNEPYSLIEK